MLLWDHSVRRLMHTSPPWDVPQASPSTINQAFRSRDAPLNPKIASSTHYKSVLFAQFVSFRSFLLHFRPACLLLHTYNTTWFDSTQSNADDSIVSSNVQSSLQILQTCHQCLKFIANWIRSRHEWFKSSFSCPIITSNSSNCYQLVPYVSNST